MASRIEPPLQPAWWICAAVLLLAGTVARIQAAGSDLWLDEVWSLLLADRVASPLDVVTSIREPNNHALNTLWLALWGNDASPYTLRALSLFFGTASLALCGAIGAQRSPATGLFAMTMVAASYLMIDASSEARGYAPMLFFALLALLALEADATRVRHGEPRSTLWGAVFALSVALGTLFQISFVLAYAALAMAFVAQRLQERTPFVAWLRDGALWHGLPLVVYAGLYTTWFRDVDVGGDVFPKMRLLGRTAMLTLGLDGGTRTMQISGAIAVAALAVGLASVARTRIDRFVLYATGTVVAPAFLLWWMEPSFLAPRYFLPCVLLFLLLGAGTLASLFSRGWAGRLLALSLLALYVLGNLATAAPLWHRGRGDFTRALAIMDRESPPGPLEVGSRFAFRDGLLLRYHARHLDNKRTLQIIGRDDWPARGPRWMILPVLGASETVGPRVRGPRNNVYEQVERFEGLPGREPAWFLYRALPRADLREMP